MKTQTPPFPKKKYKAILCDPPWTFETYSAKGKDRSAEQHYPCMTKEDIQNLPIQDLAEEDCVLFLWVTYPCLKEGMELIDKWGFSYKTCAFMWAKKNKSNMGFFMGMGYWTRANGEICLLATKGKPNRREVVEGMKDHEKSTNQRQLIVSPIREHSRKPDEQYNRIEYLVEGPYIELFSRCNRQGWDSWGLETGKLG